MIKRMTITIIALVTLMAIICGAVPMYDENDDSLVSKKEVVDWAESYSVYLERDYPAQVDQKLNEYLAFRLETKATETSSS